MSVSFLSMIERGDRVPHLESLMKLAAALRVSLAEMFSGVGESAKGGASPLRPLIEYLERQDLDAHEVEVLLIVARALYEHKR
jgi:transcriptional regulator with XRE-family HTH domain